MKKYDGFEAKKDASYVKMQLPAGGYVVEIKGAKVEETDYGEKLAIMFDVAEGEFKNFFQKDYDENPNEDKKWRGSARINIPTGSEDDDSAWVKKRFENFIWAVTDSNSGFNWAWDESKLKGKKVGVVYREAEWVFGDKFGIFTKPWNKYFSVDDIKAGKYKVPPMLENKNKPVSSSSTLDDVTGQPDIEDALPF